MVHTFHIENGAPVGSARRKKQALHAWSSAHVSLHPPEFCHSMGGVNVHLGGVGGGEISAASTSTQPPDFRAVNACKSIKIFRRSYGLPPRVETVRCPGYKPLLDR